MLGFVGLVLWQGFCGSVLQQRVGRWRMVQAAAFLEGAATHERSKISCAEAGAT